MPQLSRPKIGTRPGADGTSSAANSEHLQLIDEMFT